MKTGTTMLLLALMSLAMGAATPALAGKLNFGGKFGQLHLLTSKNSQASKSRKLEEPTTVNPGTGNRIKRPNAGRRSGFKSGS